MPPRKNKHQGAYEVSVSLSRSRTARDIVLRSINKMLEIANESVKNPEKRSMFEARFLSLEKFVAEFDIEQKQILSILAESDQIDRFREQDEEISETMQVMCDKINVIAASFKKNVTTIPSPRSENGRAPIQSLILPRIEILKFDGDIVSWRSFRDMFQSLVHENNAYSDIERFHYLRSYLSGPALKVVSMVPLTADNYSIAWTALQNRYENQRLLVTAHFEKLFAFTPLQKESTTSLSSFVDTFRENVAAIEALGVVDVAGFLLFYIGSRVIDPMTRRLFEASIDQSKLPNLEMLLEFVSKRCKILENVGSNSRSEGKEDPGRASAKITKGWQARKTSLAATAPIKTEKCTFCELPHKIYRCFAFKKKSVAARRDFASKNKLCYICLYTGHMSGGCSTAFTCRVCSGKHNTLLHLADSTSKTDTEIPNEKFERTTSTSCNAQFTGTSRTDTTVLLGTVMIRIFDNTGVLRSVRAVLDSGSQVSAMTLDCVNRLGLTRSKCRMEITGLSQQPVATVKGQIQCSFFPTQSDLPEFKANNVIVLPNIMSATPNGVLPPEVRERYRHLVLADPQFDRPAPVDMLIGGDLYPFIIQTRADIIHTTGLPSAMSTNLGWVVIGTLEESRGTLLTSLSVSATPAFEEVMQQFWAVEEPSQSVTPTTQDRQCEEWFAKTVTRDTTGRFYVGLPFRTTVCPPIIAESGCDEGMSVVLGSSKTLALNRLYNLERRLAKKPELYDAYRVFMDEYIYLGHMRLAMSSGKYFIPHHPVVKQDSTGLKIRVVFDASAPSSTGASLNDCLITGPKLQTEIGDVLLRNRLQKFVFTADITKMYRQIRIHEQDRAYQHILWRSSPSEEVREYELCTVTYGVSSAPFLAIRCLRQLDEEDGPDFPLAKNILVDDTYVDDIFAGADTVDDILEMQSQIIGLLQRGGFVLKKWASNCPKILNGIAKEDRAVTPWIDPHKEQAIKVLGVHWDTKEDTFGYHSSLESVKPTKRSVLSTVARLYDPIGVLGPMIFWAKCLMQRLWIERLDWDTPLPTEMASMWLSFIAKLDDLHRLSLPRYIFVRESQDIQLVGFADASQLGYAATVFLRVVDKQGVIQLYFVACKTKVAPLKSASTDLSLTIPRLELCAALLLARLMSQRLRILRDKINIARVRAWTDSTIVLAWLTAEQKSFKIFVTNRVAKIQNLLPQCDWAHVDTTENPADPASRGLFPDDLVSCSLFRHGPTFLFYPENQWPSIAVSDVLPEQLPEYKGSVKCVLICQEDDSFIKRFSSLGRMQRVLAYCLRFVDKLRQRPTNTGSVSWRECENVLVRLVRYTQIFYYPDLLKQLTNSSLTVTPNTLAQLAPFLDPHGIIRVGGRLKYSVLSSDAKHPMLLPKAAHLTNLIIQHYHHNTLHGGTRLILSLIQRRFWIVSGRAAVRRVLYRCIPCTKYKAATPQPKMAELPSTRVQAYRPFTNIGMDYGGPFIIKESRRRNAKTHKAYLALFVCLSTKAVHLEVVSDLTTTSFLAALDRFIARRGIPTQIQSDCGTNYVGAARQLKALFQDAEMQNTLQSRVPCQWKFNPPAAPHFGGIWEAAIKSTKLHLAKVIGIQVYTFEELMTLIIRVEGVLNSRPLVPTSNDPNDLCALTPGHFLIGQPIMAIPEPDIREVPQNRLNRWQLLKQAFQSFWTRWSREYLHTLQSRQKWYVPDPNLQVGDMVIINSPAQPPLAWHLGRIIAVHPGSDDVVRVATVRTAVGVLTRPVVKLVKLPTA